MPFFKLNETAPKALLQVVDTGGALVTAGVYYDTAGLTIYVLQERGTLVIYGAGGNSLIQSLDPAGTHNPGKVYNAGGGMIQFDLPTAVADDGTQANAAVWGVYTGGELIAVPGLVGGGVGGLPVLDANSRVSSNVTAMDAGVVSAIQSGLATDAEAQQIYDDMLTGEEAQEAAALALEEFGASTFDHTTHQVTVGSLTSGAVAAIWNALTSGMTTAGSIGKKLADAVFGGSGGSGDCPTADEIADEVEGRFADRAITVVSSVLDGGHIPMVQGDSYTGSRRLRIPIAAADYDGPSLDGLLSSSSSGDESTPPAIKFGLIKTAEYTGVDDEPDLEVECSVDTEGDVLAFYVPLTSAETRTLEGAAGINAKNYTWQLRVDAPGEDIYTVSIGVSTVRKKVVTLE